MPINDGLSQIDPNQELADREAAFNAQWGLNITIDGVDTARKQTSFLSKHELTVSESPRMRYLGVLENIISIYLNKHSAMNEENSYDKMHSFSASMLLEEYEGLMSMKFRAEHQNDAKATREPYEGINHSKLLNGIKEMAEPFNKTVPEFWSDKVIKGSMSVKKMRKITDRAFRRLTREGADSSKMTKEDDVALQNVIAAQEALSQVREKRSAWWYVAPWHWVPGAREYFYSKNLDEQRKALSARYDVQAASNRVNAKLLDGPKLAADDNKKKSAAPEQVNNVTKRFDHIAKKVNNLWADEKHMEDFIKRMITSLPKKEDGSPVEGDARPVINEFMGMQKILLRELNNQYDKAQASGLDCNQLMDQQIRVSYIQLLSYPKQLGYESPQKQVLAAQMITDMLFKEFTVAGHNEAMSKYADGYMLKDAKQRNTSLYGEASEDMDKAIQEYEQIKNPVVNNSDSDPSRQNFVDGLKIAVNSNIIADDNKSPFVNEEAIQNPAKEINQN
jgi:hypothetical protein